jgi:hypothetical protein
MEAFHINSTSITAKLVFCHVVSHGVLGTLTPVSLNGAAASLFCFSGASQRCTQPEFNTC